jgi:hypothetical protein
MAETHEPARHLPAGPAPTILDLLRDRVLDAELAALGWLLLDARVPLLVAGIDQPAPAGEVADPGRGRLDRRRVLQALLDFLPPAARRIPLALSGAGLDRLTSADAATAWLVGLDLGPAPAPGVRLAFRALSRGAVLAASLEADSLEAVFARLRRPDLRLTDDELTFIGLVLVVRTVPREPGLPTERGLVDRVVAAHYVRPLARDPAGHFQRQAPAVLATWEPRDDAFEHFAWGIATELAGRAGLRPGDLEPELERRRVYLAGLLAAGLVDANQLRSALDGYRLADSRESGA